MRNGLLAVVERAFLHFLQSAMTRYEKRSGVDATARLKAKLIARRAATMAGADTSRQTATAALQDAAELEQHLIAMLWAASEAKVRETHLLAHEAKLNPPPAPVAPAPTQEDLRPLVHMLTQHLDEAATRSADTLARLKTVAASLEHATNLREMHELRDILRDGVAELLRDNRGLDDRVRQARYNAKQLSFKISGTASVSETALNRDELLRRVEAEARRAERHCHSLSLALLGPDHRLGADQLIGTGAEDEIVRHYLENITSCARAYDFVAPYRPHGLVWLLPGTGIAQGVKALNKVQQRVAAQRYEHDGRARALPTFSGAVIRYTAGETPTAFLARAETLALQARHAGPNRIECEQ